MKTVAERFWAKVETSPTCWYWTGACHPRGYGKLGSTGLGTDIAHRVAYLLLRGPIPPGMTIDHLCHTTACRDGNACLHRRCVNPDHLEAVPSAVNHARGRGGERQATCARGHDRSQFYLYFGRKVYCKPCRREARRQRQPSKAWQAKQELVTA